jgi:bacterioferritin-associated ferredoxin
VSEDDVRRAVAEGYDELETLKRFTGACTGPCQGKTCVEAIRRLVAELTGRDLADVPAPPRRPPAAPVRLGTLAAQVEAPAAGGEAPAVHDEAPAAGAGAPVTESPS